MWSAYTNVTCSGPSCAFHNFQYNNSVCVFLCLFTHNSETGMIITSKFSEQVQGTKLYGRCEKTKYCFAFSGPKDAKQQRMQPSGVSGAWWPPACGQPIGSSPSRVTITWHKQCYKNCFLSEWSFRKKSRTCKPKCKNFYTILNYVCSQTFQGTKSATFYYPGPGASNLFVFHFP